MRNVNTRPVTEMPHQTNPAPEPARLAPWRALALGAGGVALLCAITPYNDYRVKNTYLYGCHLPIGGLFLFALLAMALNPLLRRYAPRRALRPGELLLVWAMLTTGAGLASSGLWRYLGPMVVAPAYFQNSGSRWLDMFQDAPGWLLLTRDPKSPLALRFYHGLPSGQPVPWAAWLPVVCAWGIAFALVVALSLGLCALFRRQWVQREKLAFPLAQLPLQIVAEAEGRQPLLRNKLFWAGCLTVILSHTASTLHYFAPSFPDALNRFDLTAWQQTPPWDALGLPTLEIFFAVIGAIFLLPADVSLTLWLTFVVFHLVRVARAQMGYDPLLIGPLNHEGAMGTGAFLVWALWLVWIARPRWREVWQAARRPCEADESEEPLSSRSALALTIMGAAGLLVWMRAAGMPLWIAALVLLLFGVILLVLTRIVAESGLLFVQTPFLPTDLMAFWGTSHYTPTAAGATLLTEVVFIHDPREHVMPAIANAYALTGPSRLQPRAFTGGIALAVGIGFFVSFVSFVWLSYRFGAVTLDAYGTDGAPHWSLDRALQYANTPLPVNPGDIKALGLGATLAALFAWMKARFLWWPFGPIGLAMASTYAMNRIWFSVFLGWACKAAVLRLGGLRWFRAALPFFLGLLLGEGLFGGAAALWGLLTGVSAPPFLPT
jgi:hypothetical protein